MPAEDPAAHVDLTTQAVVDLRLAKVEATVGAPAMVGHADARGITTLHPRASLPRRHDEDDAGARRTERADIRPVPEPVPDFVVDPDSVDRDISYIERTTRGAWPEIRFYLGSAALFFIAFAIATGMWVLGPMLVLGWDSAAITSGSMEPSIRVGDVVVFDASIEAPLASGTVVTFEDATGDLTTHRVIGVYDDGSYVTKGDSNDRADSTPVAHESVRGEGRLLVPFAGYPAYWLSSGSPGAVGLVALGFGLLTFASRWALLPRFSPWPSER